MIIISYLFYSGEPLQHSNTQMTLGLLMYQELEGKSNIEVRHPGLEIDLHDRHDLICVVYGILESVKSRTTC